VAAALTRRDGLAAHAKEELHIDLQALARPVQAAASSAASFAVGAALPLAAIGLSSAFRLPVTLVVATLALAALGGWSARLGGAPVGRAVLRVVVGGVAAMGLTAGIGALFAAA
jgi:VIT1/CCC1 family predicted Fe2+/Mn2+ transporter